MLLHGWICWTLLSIGRGPQLQYQKMTLSRIKQKHTGKGMLGLKHRRQSKDGQLPCQEIFQVWLQKEGEMLRCLCWYHFSDAPFCFSSWAAHSILLISALRTLLPLGTGVGAGSWPADAGWWWSVKRTAQLGFLHSTSQTQQPSKHTFSPTADLFPVTVRTMIRQESYKTAQSFKKINHSFPTVGNASYGLSC